MPKCLTAARPSLGEASGVIELVWMYASAPCARARAKGAQALVATTCVAAAAPAKEGRKRRGITPS